MSIPVTCRCGKSFRVKDEHAGKKGKCPACGDLLLVPDHADTAAQRPKRHTTAKRKLCSKCGGIVEPEAAIVEEDGRVICPTCIGERPNDTKTTARSRRPLLIGGVVGAVLVVVAAAYLLAFHSSTATTGHEVRANTASAPAAQPGHQSTPATKELKKEVKANTTSVRA